VSLKQIFRLWYLDKYRNLQYLVFSAFYNKYEYKFGTNFQVVSSRYVICKKWCYQDISLEEEIIRYLEDP